MVISKATNMKRGQLIFFLFEKNLKHYNDSYSIYNRLSFILLECFV